MQPTKDGSEVHGLMSSGVENDDEISLFALGTALVRNRWRIAAAMFAGALVAGVSVYQRPTLYEASASFFPQGYDPGRSGLSDIAAQLGRALPTTNQSISPEFYATLLRSRELLRPVAYDTFTVHELGKRKMTFFELFGISEGSPAAREEAAVSRLMGIVSADVDRMTGVVEVSVVTPWRSVSLAIATVLVTGVDEYNQRTRQGQAASERRFVESRLAIARDDLRTAEDRLQRFLQTNRQFGGSPELTFERERLQRDVTLRQEVFTSLMKSYEDVRIREVRDTPGITMFEQPSAPLAPLARGRLKSVLLGLIIGGIIGTVFAILTGVFARRRMSGRPEVDEFVGSLGEAKAEMLRPVRWLRQRAQ